MHALVVEDTEVQLKAILEAIKPVCDTVLVARTLEEAEARLAEEPPDVIILDCNFPCHDRGPHFLAVDFLARLERWASSSGSPLPTVFLETDHDIDDDDREKVERLLDAGKVEDVVLKPAKLSMFQTMIKRKVLSVQQRLCERPSEDKVERAIRNIPTLRASIGQQEGKSAPSETTSRDALSDIIGETPCMKEVARRILRFGASRGIVLISGPTGTGKDLVAHAIHKVWSGTTNRPFIAVPFISDSLVEAELFGTATGVATEVHGRAGHFEEAGDGTVFLDQIESQSPRFQENLLRVLEENHFGRVGERGEYRELRCKVVAATECDLEQLVSERRFREALLYRLRSLVIQLPRLRDRRQDIPLLIDHFLSRQRRERSRQGLRISVEARRVLEDYHWPGNVRELRQAIDSMAELSDNDELNLGDLPPYIRNCTGEPGRALASITSNSAEVVGILRRELDAEAHEEWKRLTSSDVQKCVSAGLVGEAKSLAFATFFEAFRQRTGHTPADVHLEKAILVLELGAGSEVSQAIFGQISPTRANSYPSQIGRELVKAFRWLGNKGGRQVAVRGQPVRVESWEENIVEGEGRKPVDVFHFSFFSQDRLVIGCSVSVSYRPQVTEQGEKKLNRDSFRLSFVQPVTA